MEGGEDGANTNVEALTKEARRDRIRKPLCLLLLWTRHKTDRLLR